MRHGKFIFFLLLIISVGAFAQEQPDYEKKWYVAPDGKFYINKDLPIYLRLATSPDEDAETHLLKSQTSKEYTNPFYFDTEGWNSIRTPWRYDKENGSYPEGQKDIIFEVYADGENPVTEAKFRNAPKYSSEGKTYYGKNLEVELEASDAVSKVADIYYSINGESYTQYDTVLTFSGRENNNFELQYYAVDNVGNAEEPNSVSFIVDEQPPVLEPELGGKVKGENRVSADAKFVINSSDNLSGVKQVKYSLDGGQPHNYNNPVPVSSFGNGDVSISIYGVDNVENSKSKDAGDTGTEFNFEIDDKAPEAELAVQGDQLKDDYHYISPRTKVKLSATDSQSDVKKILYGVNTSPETTYNNPFSLETDKGIQVIRYSAKDELDNVSQVADKRVYMDNATPVTAIDYKRPRFFNRDTLFINKTTNIEIFSSDNESGVKKTEYQLDGGSWEEYNSEFNISEAGYHTIKFRSYDKVNNQESAKTSNVYVDNTAPKIYHNFSIERIGQSTKNGTKYNVYPAYSKLYLGATDENSGTEQILYSINGGEMQDYSSRKDIDISKVKGEGFYEIKIIAEDKLGNKKEKKVNFFIRKN